MSIPISASRESVLDSAQELLIQHGYAGLSMRELARQSGLAKSTIYHHFHNKRDLFLCVLERDLNLVSDRIGEAAGADGSWTERLRAVVRTYFELQKDRRPLILTALREQADMETELCDLLLKFRARLVEPIAALVTLGIEQGDARPLHVPTAVLSLLGILHGFVGQHILLESSASGSTIGEDSVESALQIFLYGITAPIDSRE